MKIFVFDPNHLLGEFADTPQGNEEAIEWIQKDMRHEGLQPSDYRVIRGERLIYTPPSGKVQLIPES